MTPDAVVPVGACSTFVNWGWKADGNDRNNPICMPFRTRAVCGCGGELVCASALVEGRAGLTLHSQHRKGFPGWYEALGLRRPRSKSRCFNLSPFPRFDRSEHCTFDHLIHTHLVLTLRRTPLVSGPVARWLAGSVTSAPLPRTSSSSASTTRTMGTRSEQWRSAGIINI